MKMKNWTYLLIFFCTACSHKPTPAPALPTVSIVTVKAADVPRFHTYIGHVKAFVQIEVRSQVEGVITGCHFQEGKEVKEGDLLLTIDSRPYEAQLAKAKAALSESLANLQYAKEVANRNAQLVQNEYVARLQFDQYLTNIETAKANIAASQADIDTANINISYCKIYSPADGVAGILQFDVGNLIRNAGQTPLITINQITPIYVYFSVPQTDLPEIMKLHRHSPLRVEAYLDQEEKRPFIGTLDFIDNQVNEQTASIWMRGAFSNEKKLLWPGQFATVRLILQIEKNALLVPIEAVQISQKGPSIFVVKSDQTVEMRVVTLGQRLGNEVVISSGLQPGEHVVTQGQLNLATGTKVTIK